MGKGPDWSAEEIVLLCKAWLDTSQDPIRSVDQKKTTFYGRIHQHRLEHLSPGMDARTEVAVPGKWKKLQPEVTKFEGIFAKLKSRERSGWNEEKYTHRSLFPPLSLSPLLLLLCSLLLLWLPLSRSLTQLHLLLWLHPLRWRSSLSH
jgi:hypothetical protein